MLRLKISTSILSISIQLIGSETQQRPFYLKLSLCYLESMFGISIVYAIRSSWQQWGISAMLVV